MAPGVQKNDYNETTYLSGPIDMVPDGGAEWRQRITPALTSLGLKIIDPIETTKVTLKISTMGGQSRTVLRNLWENKKEEYYRVMDQIEEDDLAKGVLASDFIITFWDWRINTYGTVVENDVAARNHIPIYCVSYAPADALPNWLRKDIHRSGGELFSEFNELLKFLLLRKNIVEQYLRKAAGK